MLQGFLNFGHRGLSGDQPPVDVRASRVIASVSGGKDSAAASLLLREHGIEHQRVFMDTGWEHPATYEYLRGPLTRALGPIVEIRGELDFVELVRKKGLFPNRVMRFCTTELKVLPIIDYIARIAANETREIVNVVGIRRAESAKRSQMPEWEWSGNPRLRLSPRFVEWMMGLPEDYTAIPTKMFARPPNLIVTGPTASTRSATRSSSRPRRARSKSSGAASTSGASE